MTLQIQPRPDASARSVRRHRGGVRNRVGWRDRIRRLQGSNVILDLSRYDEPLTAINGLEGELRSLGDADLQARAAQIGERLRHGADRVALCVPLFALAREASRRTLGLRPFDVQIVAALALADGHVVEMQTGEGKTLAAVMPACLDALSGRGMHILTFNDYLARRDAEWMGPVYRWLGVSVGAVHQTLTASDRRRAYAADVTYVTAKEAGFDHLRDQLARDIRHVVHRPFHAALIDEADSLLIDEARVPLVIAGSVGRESASRQLAGLVATFVAGADFDQDEYGRNVQLTDAGIDRAERALGCGSLHDDRNYTLLTELNCALHAHTLLRRDVDYLVRDGRIGIIDESTGRVVPDRHWPDGLQAALEAREGLERQADGRILGSITLQHFLSRYPRLSGMTGTAQAAAAEVHELYGLNVVVVPTHLPMIRIDRPDLVFTHREAKDRAVVDEIRRAHASARPVLVGTMSVEESEQLAARLRASGIPCQVLNAKNDAAEADVIASAGAPRAVTISTNMAGRGTDIRLGGADERDRDRVRALGGLYVIGTNRHESRRIDQQLRGRAGRQGDPGESQFLVSLEDGLLVRYGVHTLLAGRFIPDRRMEPVDHPVVVREVARAQRIVEGQNIEIRRTLWRYASIVEEQRKVIMERRQAILEGREHLDVWQRSGQRPDTLREAGADAVVRAEREVTLHCVDTAWRDHLAFVADLREGIHLVALGGQDPLRRFTAEATAAFHRLDDAIDEAVLEALHHVRPGERGLDLTGLDINGPSSTWTYLVNDDPFRHQIGMMLTGPGRATFAVGAALAAMPLLILWGLVDRFYGKKPGSGVRSRYSRGGPASGDREGRR